MASTELAMGTRRSTISHDVTICCAVLGSLHHALAYGTSRLFIVLSDMLSGHVLGIFLLWILMPCLTILSRSDNLTNLLIEGFISWFGGFEMCDRLFLPKRMYCSGWFSY